jgi:hypothetical protein
MFQSDTASVFGRCICMVRHKKKNTSIVADKFADNLWQIYTFLSPIIFWTIVPLPEIMEMWRLHNKVYTVYNF